jgi:hypothetical protein
MNKRRRGLFGAYCHIKSDRNFLSIHTLEREARKRSNSRPSNRNYLLADRCGLNNLAVSLICTRKLYTCIAKMQTAREHRTL